MDEPQRAGGSTPPPTLIALDWGTTNLRATLLDGEGSLIAHRNATAGILNVKAGDFEAALHTLCADWLATPNIVTIASGMIGSRQGWAEAPYLDAPASPLAAAHALTRVGLATGGVIYLIAGVRCTVGEASDVIDDVMRGEETQIWGADFGPDVLVILPGTHSKWVRCGPDGAIESFRTWMTGELFAVMSQHSILGRLMQPGKESSSAFIQGADRGLAAPEALGALLFSVRTAGLMARLDPHALSDYLSGLLIGAEVAAALQQFAASPPARSGSDTPVTARPPHPRSQQGPLHLIGEPDLCSRYATVLSRAGVGANVISGSLAARGAWRVAQAAGLIPARHPSPPDR